MWQQYILNKPTQGSLCLVFLGQDFKREQRYQISIFDGKKFDIPFIEHADVDNVRWIELELVN